jgi:hypothetical protein
MEVQTANMAARLTMLSSPEDKRGIEAWARGLDMSLSEDLPLEAAVQQWARNAQHMRKMIAETPEYSAKMRAERDEVRLRCGTMWIACLKL